MQPQSAQNINLYISQSAANSAGIIGANQPNYRPSHTPSSSAPRNRFMTNPMYLPTVQSVVPPQYSYQTRQPQYIQQYISHGTHTHTPYYASNIMFSNPYYVQQPPQHQRAITVQPSVPSVSSGGGAANSIVPTAMVGGVLQPTHSTTATGVGVGVGLSGGSITTTTRKPRPYALKIIHPDTKRNILDDLKSERTTSTSEGEVQEQSNTIMETSQIKANSTTINNGFPPDLRKYETSVNTICSNQTPVVSAISNAPSVEIYTQTKPKTKKLHKDKETSEKLRMQKFDENVSQQQSPTNVVQNTDSVHEFKHIEMPEEVFLPFATIQTTPLGINNDGCYSILTEEEKLAEVGVKSLLDDCQLQRKYVETEEGAKEENEKNEVTPTLTVHSIPYLEKDLIAENASKLDIDVNNVPTNAANIASIKSNEFTLESLDESNFSTRDNYESSSQNKENCCHYNKTLEEKKEAPVLENASVIVETNTEANRNIDDDNCTIFSSLNTTQLRSEKQDQCLLNNKYKYDRHQLLQLRNVEASLVQPNIKFSAILPGVNLMPAFASKKFSLGLISSTRSGDGSNTQKYNYKESQIYGPSYSHSGDRGNVIHVNLLLNQDVKLNESTNAWRPRILKKNDSSNLVDPKIKAQQEKEDITRKVRGILNKLTPEKFDVLLKEVLKLQIDNMEKLDAVMILVFEKAIDEPNFSVCYAKLCQRLISEVTPKNKQSKTTDQQNNKAKESGPNKGNLSQFRTSLIDKTESEFIHNVINANAKDKKLEPLKDKFINCSDPNEKVELKALLEEEERKVRRRSGGTVRFIGELFKHNILSCKVIVGCIHSLIKNSGNQDMLECLCKLLTTVGEKLEKTALPNTSGHCYSLDDVIQKMQAIASANDNPKISSRVRFMLQDVIDLRKNKWQSTRNETPTTMDQIEKEAYTQKLGANYGVLSAGNNSNFAKRENRYNDTRTTYNGSLSQRGERARGFGSSGGTNVGGSHNSGSTLNKDGSIWLTQTSKNNHQLMFDSNKLEAMQMTNIGEKRMGTASQFQWQISDHSNQFAPLSTLESNKSSTNDNEKNIDRSRVQPRNKNSYTKGSSEHSRYSDRDKSSFSRSSNSQGTRENFPIKTSQASRNMDISSSTQKSPNQLKHDSLQSISSCESNSEKLTSKLSTLSIGSVDRSQNSQHKDSELSQTTPEAVSNVPPEIEYFEQSNNLDLKEFKAVASELIDNATSLVYLSEEYDYQVVSCIKQLKKIQHCDFIYYVLTDYLHLCKIGPMHRRHLSNCITYLVQNNYLTVEHFLLAYMRFTENATDLLVDIPNLWNYVFEFIGSLIVKNLINIKQLWPKTFENYTVNFRQKFLAAFLQYMKCDVGPNFTRELWRKSNLKWTDFMPGNEVTEFININKLDYIENDKIRPEVIATQLDEKQCTRIFDRVNQLLKERTTADRIIDYLNGNVREADKNFMIQLTSTLTNHCINYSRKLDVSSFQELCIPVILHYINKNNALEIECLYALQILDHNLEHPRDLLRDLFVQLNDNDVVPRETFLRWRDSKEHSVGKGVAVKALNPFFNQVLNGEASDD